MSQNDPRDGSIVPTTPPPVPPLSSLRPAVTANIYIWTNPVSELRPELWEYEQFVKENAWKWVGDGSAQNPDYLKVDERRDMGGIIVRG